MAGTASSGGRNRKSATQHRLEGTFQKGRHAAAAATDPDPLPVGRPPIPIGLIGPALEEWRRMVDRLELAKTISTVDDAALYQYCCLFAETELVIVAHRTNVALVEKLQGAIDKLTNGDQIVEAISQIVQLKKLEAKLTAQLRQGHLAVRQYLVELGMTPAARSRVDKTDTTPAAADPFAEFDAPAGAKH